MSQAQTLRGIFAPTLTSFRADLSVDVERWVVHCQHLLATGCHGLCPFGTTSEANSLSIDERVEMLEQLIAAGVPAGNLMPGTGTSAIPDTVRLTRHAVGVGCAGVLLLPPFFYKGVSDEGIFRSVAEVIERVADNRLRVYLYHIPPMAQVGFSLGLVERLIKTYPQTVVGLKDSSGDWKNQEALLKAFPGFAIFSGGERFLLDNLRLGGAGGINGVANTIPNVLRKLYENWQGDEAEALQEWIVELRKPFQEYAAIPGLKQIIAHFRQDPAWTTVRPPLVALPSDQATALVAGLDEVNYPWV
ncbi:MAG: dihydrodipicolinate synthase family protein [Chloroflexi bacterium]|nr:MAG: dihydrodipicolinate synthase family protein [Chloroflexota bacterium]